MDMEVVELKVTLARVLERLDTMRDLIESQDKIIQAQGEQIAKLVSLADQGRGGVWTLVALGGVIGALISNAKAIVQFFVR